MLADFVGLCGVVSLLGSSSDLARDSSSLLVPQPHFCFFGIAAVTRPQEHGRDAGCGQVLSGRPGFRTGTISRSLACVHLVERCPRIQGSLKTLQLATC